MKGRERGYASHSALWIFKDLGPDRDNLRAVAADGAMLGG